MFILPKIDKENDKYVFTNGYTGDIINYNSC